MKHKINTATGTCSACGLNTTTGFTKECLNEPMHELTKVAVYRGEIDYYDGGFHSKTDAKEETLTDILKGIAGRHGIKVVELHAPRIRRANNAEHLRHNPEANTRAGNVNEPSARDDYVPKPADLDAYKAMEELIKEFMADPRQQQAQAEVEQAARDMGFNVLSNNNPNTEEYALSKDEIEFLKRIADEGLLKQKVANLQLSQKEFMLLWALKTHDYVYVNTQNTHYIATSKAVAHLESLSKPAPLVMTEEGIALLLLLSDDSIDNDEVMSAEIMPDATDLLVDLGLARNCGEHLHITTKGRVHIKNLLEMKIN